MISFQIFLCASQQIILVVSNDFNSSTANMECFEDDKTVCSNIQVNLGKNGLGWGIGEYKLPQKKDDPIKKEGDKKAPAGIFKLTTIFGYEKKQNFHMPYIFSSKNLICVDDIDSKYYNQIIHMPQKTPKSFEKMKRDDELYKIGIVVAHNKKGIKKRGSCIFIHIQRDKKTPTVGCTSMSYKNLKDIVEWLDIRKNPILIQIPKSSVKDVMRLYPQLKSSKLHHL
jgi:L,D-peptidoglycan transpeptidase YkuD (ErfK/YbiS/YcfS/YnhG family)